MKIRAQKYAKALVAAGTSGLGAGIAVAVTGPGAGSPEAYITGIILAIFAGTAVALKANKA